MSMSGGKHYKIFSMFFKSWRNDQAFPSYKIVSKHVSPCFPEGRLILKSKTTCHKYYLLFLQYELNKIRLTEAERKEIEKRTEKKQSQIWLWLFNAARCEMIGVQQWHLPSPNADVLIHNFTWLSLRRGFRTHQVPDDSYGKVCARPCGARVVDE